MAGHAIKHNEQHRQSTLNYRCMNSSAPWHRGLNNLEASPGCAHPLDPQPDFTALQPTMPGGSYGQQQPRFSQPCTTVDPHEKLPGSQATAASPRTSTEQIARFRDF